MLTLGFIINNDKNANNDDNNEDHKDDHSIFTTLIIVGIKIRLMIVNFSKRHRRTRLRYEIMNSTCAIIINYVHRTRQKKHKSI